jgi:hypothetical protein
MLAGAQNSNEEFLWLGGVSGEGGKGGEGGALGGFIGGLAWRKG